MYKIFYLNIKRTCVQYLIAFNHYFYGAKVKLTLLIPKYINKIPYTAIGISKREYTYKVNDDNKSYKISFIGRLGFSHIYMSDKNLWVVID